MKVLGEGSIPYDGGLYPWEWVQSDLPNFRALQGGLLVAPILQKLILNREPEKVLNWAEKVSQWPIKRIIPCHLANDIKATGSDFRRAFEFLEEPAQDIPFPQSLFQKKPQVGPQPLEADCKLLSDASVALTAQGVLNKPGALVARKRRY